MYLLFLTLFVTYIFVMFNLGCSQDNGKRSDQDSKVYQEIHADAS